MLSAWLIWLDPLINRDAIIYLRAAEAYLQDGIAASQQVFGRPLLPICMAIVHQVTGLSLLHAGLLITTLFYVVLCVAFVDIVRILGGKRSVQLIAAIVILSHPWINHTRASIMRDPVYLALLLLSLRELLLFCRTPSALHQVRWTLLVLAAALFRFEGFFIAAVAPTALLFTRGVDKRGQRWLQLLLPQLAICGLIIIGVVAYSAFNPQASALFPGINLYIERLGELPSAFADIARQSAEPLLAFTSRDDATLAGIAALFAILLLNLCRALTWPWLLVLLWGWRAGIGHRFRRDDLAVIATYACITLFYLATFVAINRFMLERYSVHAVLFLLLLLPFALSALWHMGGWRKYLALALLLGMCADILHSGAREKLFIVEATRWIADNTPAGASLVTNEQYIAHFSEREVDWETLRQQRFQLDAILQNPDLWRNRDYLVIYVKRRNETAWQAFLERHRLQELRSFPGGSVGRAAVVPLYNASAPIHPRVN